MNRKPPGTNFLKWLTPGISIKRWIVLVALGAGLFSLCLAITTEKISPGILDILSSDTSWLLIIIGFIVASILQGIGLFKISQRVLAPYRRNQNTKLVDDVVEHSRLGKGFRFVAIGGGTGLPAALRAMKAYTSNITAIVTVADDGGSSGRLRREMGIAPPGDLRNNIAALADDDSLLTRLFQYRFPTGELSGHAFGNLFIAALASVVDAEKSSQNSLAEALIVTENVLNIRGRVLPATLDEVGLIASIRLNNTNRVIRVRGESQIGDVDGQLEMIELEPSDIEAYPESVSALREADIVVIGPGSLYTSILPNLMVKGIADALRATQAYKIYVCNVATQPVETAGYTVAQHVMALERHIGRGVFQAVLANSAYPLENAGTNTNYVQPAPSNHEILQRYEVRYTDLVDVERPWRHDPHKLAAAILNLMRPDLDEGGGIKFSKAAVSR